MEGSKRRKLSLKIRRDSSNVEVIPETTANKTLHTESKGLVQRDSVGKENAYETEMEVYSAPRTSSSTDNAFRRKWNTENTENKLGNSKELEKKACISVPQMSPLQQKLLQIEQQFASRYSSWDIPPFPEPDTLKSHTPKFNSSPSDATKSPATTTFPPPCFKCAEIKAAIKKCTTMAEKTDEISSENNEKPSLKESLKQLFSIENLNTTLPSSQPEIDLTLDTTQHNLDTHKTADNRFTTRETNLDVRSSNAESSKKSKPHPKTTNVIDFSTSEGRFTKSKPTKTINVFDASTSSEHPNSRRLTEEKERFQDQEKGESSSKERTEDNNFLQQCPLCQVTFEAGTSQLDKDGHIAQCLSMAGDDAMW